MNVYAEVQAKTVRSFRLGGGEVNEDDVWTCPHCMRRNPYDVDGIEVCGSCETAVKVIFPSLSGGYGGRLDSKNVGGTQ